MIIIPLHKNETRGSTIWTATARSQPHSFGHLSWICAVSLRLSLWRCFAAAISVVKVFQSKNGRCLVAVFEGSVKKCEPWSTMQHHAAPMLLEVKQQNAGCNSGHNASFVGAAWGPTGDQVHQPPEAIAPDMAIARRGRRWLRLVGVFRWWVGLVGWFNPIWLMDGNTSNDEGVFFWFPAVSLLAVFLLVFFSSFVSFLLSALFPYLLPSLLWWFPAALLFGFTCFFAFFFFPFSIFFRLPASSCFTACLLCFLAFLSASVFLAFLFRCLFVLLLFCFYSYFHEDFVRSLWLLWIVGFGAFAAPSILSCWYKYPSLA